MPDLHAPLLAWFDRERRDLPWRAHRDPYAVWVSEIMLQQTQVATVLPYFERWMARFPTVQALAAAEEAEVLALWQGLGYYRRGRNLLAGARQVAASALPTSASEWRTLPGVGRYTAAAIASMAQGEAVALVDGNVERVFARLTACEANGPELTRLAWQWAEAHLHPDRPGPWNEALMELGATLCTPSNPQCPRCPLAASCRARALGRQAELPRPAPRREVVQLQRRCLIPRREGLYGLRPIPEGRWWAGMWEFPAWDAQEPAPIPHGPTRRLGVIRHAVTHHRITMAVETAEAPHADLAWHPREALDAFAMPAPQRKALALSDRASALDPPLFEPN